MYPKIYRIPSDNFQSYIILDEEAPLLFHSGKITQLNIVDFKVLMGGSQLITTDKGMKFLIPVDDINYSYPPTLLKEVSLLVKENNPRVATEIFSIVNENFIPSSTFNGSRPGYVFTTREKGTGYYKDNKPKNIKVQQSQQSVFPTHQLADTEEFLRRQYNID